MQAHQGQSNGNRSSSQQPPSRLLLATDLSARCDRALDRSVYLARLWGASLSAVTVVDPSTPPQQALLWVEGEAREDAMQQLARNQLRHAVPATDIDIQMRLVRGTDTAMQVRSVADQVKADMVIAGVARNEIFGRYSLGATVDNLAENLKVPFLVVRQRAMGPYRNIYICTDFSEPSRRALRLADHMFPHYNMTLYHAKGASLLGGRPGTTEDSKELVERLNTFVQQTTDLVEPERIRTVADRTNIVRSMPARAVEEGIDLVIMGHRGAGSLRHLFMGSTSGQLLQWLPCDVMLVP